MSAHRIKTSISRPVAKLQTPTLEDWQAYYKLLHKRLGELENDRLATQGALITLVGRGSKRRMYALLQHLAAVDAEQCAAQREAGEAFHEIRKRIHEKS